MHTQSHRRPLRPAEVGEVEFREWLQTALSGFLGEASPHAQAFAGQQAAVNADRLRELREVVPAEADGGRMQKGAVAA